VGTDGKEFSGSKDAPIAASFAKAMDKVISAQKFDNKANCHGTTFANGKVWINNDQITKKTLGAMGYRPLEKSESAQGRDIAMYTNNGEYVHSATFNSDGGSVTSKSDIGRV